MANLNDLNLHIFNGTGYTERILNLKTGFTIGDDESLATTSAVYNTINNNVSANTYWDLSGITLSPKDNSYNVSLYNDFSISGNTNLQSNLFITGNTTLYNDFYIINGSGNTAVEYSNHEFSFNDDVKVSGNFFLLNYTGSSAKVTFLNTDGTFFPSELLKANDESIDTGYDLFIDAGDEAYFKKMLKYSGGTGTYTDITTTIGGFNNSITTLENTNDYVYFGDENQFAEILFASINVAGSGITSKIEYWNGSVWSGLTIADGTSGFTVTERNDLISWLPLISWNIPVDWVENSVSGETYYWVRLSTTTSPVTPPSFELVRPKDNRPFALRANKYDTDSSFRTDDKGFLEIENLLRFYSNAWSVLEFYPGVVQKIKNTATNRTFTFQYDTIDNATSPSKNMMRIRYSNIELNPDNTDMDFIINKDIIDEAYRYDAGDDTHNYYSPVNLTNNLNFSKYSYITGATDGDFWYEDDSLYFKQSGNTIDLLGGTSNYNILYVDYVNGSDINGTGTEYVPYKTIKKALSEISDSDTYNRYLIKLSPAIQYEDNPLSMKPYIKVEGSSLSTSSVIGRNSGSSIFELVNNSTITDLTLINTGGTCLEMNSSGLSLLYQITFLNSNKGLVMNNSNAKILADTMIASAANSSTTLDRMFDIQAGDLDATLAYILSDSYVNYMFYFNSSNSNGLITNSLTESNNLNTAIYVNDNSDVLCLSSKFFNCDIACHIGLTGTSRLVTRGVSLRDTQTYDLQVDSENGLWRGFNTCIRRDKILVENPNIIKNYGFDSFEGNFRTIGNSVFGLDGEGSSVSMGEGGHYKYNIKVLTFDGTSYNDNDVDSNISLPNVSANTAIYFGDTDKFKFYSIKYYGVSGITLNGGNGVWEYYDGGVSDWVQIDSMNTLFENSDSDNANNFLMSYGTGKSYDIRFDFDIDEGIYYYNTGATGWSSTTINSIEGYWLRYRITSDIVQSFTIKNIRLGGNFTTFKKNGTKEYNGKARDQIDHFIIMADNDGLAANSSFNVSTNITFPGVKNSLENNKIDTIYGKFVLPQSIDTSSSIRLNIEWFSNDITADATTGLCHLYASPVEKNSIYNGGNSEQIIDFQFIKNAGDTQYTSYRTKLKEKINISNLKFDDILYFKLERLNNEVGDNMDDIIITNIWISYHKWQDGSNFETIQNINYTPSI